MLQYDLSSIHVDFDNIHDEYSFWHIHVDFVTIHNDQYDFERIHYYVPTSQLFM